jgi:negative regulator of sigma E activity
MNEEFEIKLQSYLDGELPVREAAEVARTLDVDAGARALFEELRTTRQWLRGNEPEHALGESREFYWTGIEREIRRLEAADAVESRPAAGWVALLRQWATPLAGAAVVALALVIFSVPDSREEADEYRYLAEVENNTEAMSAISFRAQSENMFVVWISERYEESPMHASSTDLRKR